MLASSYPKVIEQKHFVKSKIFENHWFRIISNMNLAASEFGCTSIFSTYSYEYNIKFLWLYKTLDWSSFTRAHVAIQWEFCEIWTCFIIFIEECVCKILGQ